LQSLCISVIDSAIQIETENIEELRASLTSVFAKRYLPRLKILDECRPDVMIYWINRDVKFRVLTHNLISHGLPSLFIVEGRYPVAYSNESPFFFILQIIAYVLGKKGYVVLTDSVTIERDGKALIFLGYPHSGKSSISAVAFYRGFKVYATENTVLRVAKPLKVVNGTSVLVYDPAIKNLYNVKIAPDGTTRHGYEYIDLETRDAVPPRELEVDKMFLIHSGFTCKGFSASPVTGRKIRKTLWYFSTSLLKGVDYYEPQPLDNLVTEEVAKTLQSFLEIVEENYRDRVFEVFGSIPEIFENTVLGSRPADICN